MQDSTHSVAHDQLEEDPAGDAPAGPRVLVVDDEKHIRKILALQLKANGYQVEVAGDGRAALEMVAANPPDLSQEQLHEQCAAVFRALSREL